MPNAPQAGLAEAVQLVEVLESAVQELKRAPSPDTRAGSDAIPERAVLDAYVRAVRALRAVALEARGRVERTATVLAEADLFTRRRRRRARKAAARLRAKTREGSR